MRNFIGILGKACLIALALFTPVLAQNQLLQPGVTTADPDPAIGYNAPIEKPGKTYSGPIPGASGAAIDFSAGYSSMMMAIPGAGHVMMNGFDATASAQLRAKLGLTADAGYARAANILGTPRNGFVATLLAGPVFYPFEHGDSRVFLHGLGGFGVVDGAEPVTKPEFRHGWLRRPAYALGGGFDRPLTGMFGLRVSGDYLRTSFFNKTGAVQPQNNFRFGVGLVFPYHKRWTANYSQP
jgi:hypothetical protein